jgi:rubrerythrin
MGKNLSKEAEKIVNGTFHCWKQYGYKGIIQGPDLEHAEGFYVCPKCEKNIPLEAQTPTKTIEATVKGVHGRIAVNQRKKYTLSYVNEWTCPACGEDSVIKWREIPYRKPRGNNGNA